MERRSIKNQHAYEKAERRNQERRIKAVDKIAHRIPAIISTKHDHRLVVYKRQDAVLLLARDGASGSARCDPQLLSLALQQVVDSGHVTLCKVNLTGELVFETERPVVVIDHQETIFERFELGELLKPSDRTKLEGVWGY